MGWYHNKSTFSCFLFLHQEKNGSQASNGACEARPPALGKEIAFRYQVSSNGHSCSFVSSICITHVDFLDTPPVSFCYLSLVKLSTSTSPLVCSSSPMAYQTSEEHLISWETNLHPDSPSLSSCYLAPSHHRQQRSTGTWVFSTGELRLAPLQTPQLLPASHLTH